MVAEKLQDLMDPVRWYVPCSMKRMRDGEKSQVNCGGIQFSGNNPPWREPRGSVESPLQPSDLALGFHLCLPWFPDYEHFGFRGLQVGGVA